MKIDAVELIRVTMPLVAPFRTSFAVETHREVTLVRVATADAEGWAECVAGRSPLYSSEFLDGAEQVITEQLLPRLFAADRLSGAAVGELLGAVRGHRMAKSAVETAVLDAELRARGMPLSQYLGATATEVVSGVSVGIQDTIPELLDAVERYLAAGYARIKLKIEPGWDVAPVAAVRERFGDQVLLQVDANSAYRRADARHLARLDAFDLLLIEQPLPEEDVAGNVELARVIRTPICLDESIVSASSAYEAIRTGACAIVNIKPGRVGGYLEARRIHDVCAAAGIPVWAGGMLETGIGRAANLALAGLSNFTLPSDISASDRYYDQDLTEPITMTGGRVAIPTGPGIGIDPIPEVLNGLATARTVIKP